MILLESHGELTFIRMTCPDHVCLFEPDRGWLFTGDLFLAERLRYLRSDEEVSALIASLREAAAPGPEGFLSWISGGQSSARNFVGAVARERASPQSMLGFEQQARDKRGGETWIP